MKAIRLVVGLVVVNMGCADVLGVGEPFEAVKDADCVAINGCEKETATPLNNNANIAIKDNMFDPSNCLKVAPTSSVTFSKLLSEPTPPLIGGEYVQGAEPFDDPKNPIKATSFVGTILTVDTTDAGCSIPFFLNIKDAPPLSRGAIFVE